MTPHEHVLGQLLGDAAGETAATPDLQRIERRARQLRRRRRSIRALLPALAVVASIGVIDSVETAPPVPSVDQAPEAAGISLLRRVAGPADAALQRVDYHGAVLDAGSARLAYETEGHRYGVATAENGKHICLLRATAGQARRPTGSIACVTSARFHHTGHLVRVFAEASGHGRGGPVVAVVVPDGYAQLHVDGQVHHLRANVGVVGAPSHATTATLVGPAGTRAVELPAAPG